MPSSAPTGSRPGPPVGETVTITLDGEALPVPVGTPVAAAIMQAGATPYRRHARDGSARAPYCMMGVCFECLVTIDGVVDCRGCLILVADGMVVDRQHGPGDG